MTTPPTFVTGSVLTAAQMNAVGLWKVAGASFSNATSFDVTGFSSNYSMYKVVIRTRRVDVAGAGTMLVDLRNGNTAVGASNYFQGSAAFQYTGAVGSLYTRNAGNNWLWGGSDSYQVYSEYTYDLSYDAGVGMSFQGTGYFAGGAYSLTNGGGCYAPTTFDRLRVTFDYGTHTGLWQLFGYRAN